MTLALSTAALVKGSGFVHRETGWLEVAHGLRIILRGYGLLVATVVSGLGLLGYWQYQVTAYEQSATRAPDGLTGWLAVATALLLFGPLVGCLLVLAGQWRCMSHITERHGAKSLIFSCLTCLILTLMLTVATVCVSAAENAKVLEDGWPGWGRLQFHLFTTIAQVVSAGFLLLNVLLFSYFVRAIAECFRDERRARRVDRYILFTGFLLGGTLFLVLGNHELTSQPGYLLGMAGCWLLYFVYHVGLVWSARSCILANRSKLQCPVSA